MKIIVLYLSLTCMLLTLCSENAAVDVEIQGNNDKKSYWYNNEAEISSYQISQARYGEIHEGKAVLIFVTEKFSIKNWTKADRPTSKDISVLKLNFTKKFNTGIYPYSMMTSSFFPFSRGKHSLKISSSSQEWCGSTYMELKNKKQFEIQVSSYFEGETKANILLEKSYLEDDFWTMIRLNPTKLPTGNSTAIPSFFYLRLMHQKVKAYKCELAVSDVNEKISSYTINYPELERTLVINYEKKFPYKIISWKETYYSGWRKSRKLLSTSAVLIQTIKSDYWNKHSTLDINLRTKLGLD